MALPTGFTELANQRYEEARKFLRNWRAEARDDFSFVAGRQWLPDDEALLKSEKRPPITFNYSEKMIDAVVGAEVSSRQEVTYSPRDVSDSPQAELWTNAAKWVRDQSNIEDEESDAFRDALICGLGWTHTKVSFEADPDGMIETDRIDPLEMLYDPATRKPGLVDRRYSFRNIWIDERIAKKLWPSAVLLGSNEENTAQGVNIVRHGESYEDESDDTDSADAHKGQILIRHYECVELEPYYRVQTESGQTQDVDLKTFDQLRPELEKNRTPYVKMNKRVYYYAYFSGESFLEGDLSPTQKGFTYQAITGKRDRNKSTWYGLTRVMKDPQRWANKWLSQILHIINSNAKGGLLAEVNAFLDQKKAEAEWAKPDSITLLKEGGINKVKEKQLASFPSGLDRLMEFALSSLPQVTGINLEALGLAARDQANVLEQSRKQAAYGLLAPVFDSLRRYRKNQGRVLLDFIRIYISDGRMIRIGGPESQQFLPLKRGDDNIRYDIIVDQSPNAPDVKEKTWQTLETLVPAAMKAGMPVPPTILKYAPIPTALALEWQQSAQQAQGRLTPEQAQKLQEEMGKLQQQNQQLQMQLKDKTAEIQMKQDAMVKEFELKAKIAELEFKLKEIEMQQKLQLQQAEGQQKLALQAQEAEHSRMMQENQQIIDADLQQQQVDNQAKLAKEKPKGDSE